MGEPAAPFFGRGFLLLDTANDRERSDGSDAASIDLRVTLAAGRKRDALALANPVIAAAGAFGVGRELPRTPVGRSLGAVVTPAVAATARRRAGPLLAEASAGLLCAVPYPTLSLSRFLRDLASRRHDGHPPLLVNLPAVDLDECLAVAHRLDETAGVAGIELDLSAARDRDTVERVVDAVRAVSSLPLVAKLTPACGDIVAAALGAARAGADAIGVAGTVPALAVDIRARRLRFGGAEAVLTGPAVKPLTLRLVYDVAGTVPLPIVASGGVATWADAVEFLMAGATAVEVGVIAFADPTAPFAVLDGLAAFLRETGERDVRALIGAGRASPMARGRRRRPTML